MLRIRLMEDENGPYLLITIKPIAEDSTVNLLISEKEES